MKSIPVETGQNSMIQEEGKNNDTITTKNKRLSVQISLTGQSFLISCAKTNKVEWKAQERWLYSLSRPDELLNRTIRILENSSLDLSQITEVNLFYHTPLYTLVPSEIWDDEDPALYLKYTLKTFPHDFIAHETILKGKTNLVYIPFVNLNNYFFEKFGSFHYYHALGPWIDYCAEVIGEKTGVFANFTSKQLDIVVFKDGALQLANSFEYHTPEDVVYYVLFVYEQVALSTEETPIYISGAVSQSTAIHSELYTYIRHVEFIPTYKLSISRLGKEKAHKELLLKLGLQCASYQENIKEEK
ncbi:MAG TPA: DUF3822 family protein [Flavobacteriaceae bacterium]|nr:DUF3822 family protein [Flavobacteriaceae bacterium]